MAGYAFVNPPYGLYSPPSASRKPQAQCSGANWRVFRSLLSLSRYLKRPFAMLFGMLFAMLGVEHVLVAIPDHLVAAFVVGEFRRFRRTKDLERGRVTMRRTILFAMLPAILVAACAQDRGAVYPVPLNRARQIL